MISSHYNTASMFDPNVVLDPVRLAGAADDAHDGIVSRALSAARRGPQMLVYQWGHVRIRNIAPPEISRAAVSLRVHPTALWDAIAARAQVGETPAMQWRGWLRPTAWALARQLLPRNVYLANLAFPRWRTVDDELFSLVVPDGTEAAEQLVELERDFFKVGMSRLLRGLELGVNSMLGAMRASAHAHKCAA